eukprot:m.264192 g.264192  ORF g.264192 m.264192 type:complete len:123 (-) comp16228_c0_seq50:2103-2471(-)
MTTQKTGRRYISALHVIGIPLWKLLLDLDPKQIVALLDLSYVTDVLSEEVALKILTEARSQRNNLEEEVLCNGYPGYDTSAGWIQFEDEALRSGALEMVSKGFKAVKLKDPQIHNGIFDARK